MITIMAAQIFIQAAVLSLLLLLVARHEADYSFAKVAMVTAGIVAGSAVLEALLMERIGWLTLIPVVAFAVFMIVRFCWIRWWKALLVVLLFLVVHVAFSTGMALLKARMDRSVMAASPVDEEDMKLAIEFQEQVADTLSGRRPRPNSTGPGEPPERTTQPQPDTTPPDEAAPVFAAHAYDWQAARGALQTGGTVTGRGGKRFALVQGQLRQEGDIVKLEHDGLHYRWRIRRITRTGIELEPLDAQASEDE